ncbi:MAG TPA: glycoside hydrolase family 27 protein [Bacillota bacterium]|nr:glycoside hydrolase family 27 protein [Bacillota bacterium]
MIALKPPMGWNSWNTFSGKISETLIKQTADYIVDNGYRDAGYTVVAIDDCWMAHERTPEGDLQPDKTKFPNGMKAVGDYLHSKGLLFGIYEDAGTMTCAGYPGSYGHERRDAQLFAEWGVDMLKYDFCYSAPGMEDRELYRRMGQALRETGRDIIFSGCWGNDGVWKWMRSCGAHMWRLTGDIADSWESIEKVGFGALGLEMYSGPCGWNDPDMLVVGLNGRGYVGEIGGGCNFEEYKSHFALWCMLSAPLLMGHDVRKTSSEIKALLQNKELIAINQDDAGIQAYRLPSTNDYITVLAKPLANGDIVFGLFNRQPVWTYMPVSWRCCGWELTDDISLTDVISGKDLGTFRAGNTFRVEGHSCLILRATRL